MGAVYLARDLTLDREVAIKSLRPLRILVRFTIGSGGKPGWQPKLSHPNIVPLHAFGEVEGMPYFFRFEKHYWKMQTNLYNIFVELRSDTGYCRCKNLDEMQRPC